MKNPRPLLALVLFPLVFAGCREDKVAFYRVPKEQMPESSPPAPNTNPMPAPTAAPGMANTAVPTADGANLAWTAPAAWQSKVGSAMRKATYTVPLDGGASAELAVTAFPGDVGGETANLTRWRGQLALPVASEAELAATLTRFDVGNLKVTVCDFANAEQRLLGAIVPFGGGTWFFKLTGPAAPLVAQKSAFVAFLKTLKTPAAP